MTNKAKILRIALMLVISVLIAGMAVAGSLDALLAPYEAGDRDFERIQIGDKIVFYHQRMIDGAIVEKDFIVYHFDKNTETLIDKKVHWRDGLPEHISIKVEKAQAESMVEGEVQFSDLYIISPLSDVFPLDPTPQNPCWVVRSIVGGRGLVTIIDSVTGEKLGDGVPPPAGGFSLSGPQYWNPCSGVWTSWYQNAEDWFNTMGYPTEAVQWPTEAKVQSHIQNPNTSMFYELAHGGSYSFASGCVGGNTAETTYATEIETWIATYRKMPFTFIGSCGGMCDISDNSLSYEFRKGSNTDTVTVGYCGMSESYCANCWSNSVDWQDALFSYMNDGDTVKQAFDKAQADYPMCASDPSCLRFAGDVNFKVVGGQCDYCLTDDYGYDWCLNVITTDDRAYYLDGTCDTGTTPLKDAIATYLYSTYGLTMTAYGGAYGTVFTYNTTFISDTLARGVWVNSGSATGQIDTWLIECAAPAEAAAPAEGPAPDRK